MFDNAVVVNQHVRWQLLTEAQQADLEANFPRHPTILPPGPTVFGEDVDPRFEKWLDAAYLQRHINDSLTEDPFG